MTAVVLDGKKLSQEIRDELKVKVKQLSEKNIVPGLGSILVGDDGPSAIYVENKIRQCGELGISSFHHHLSSDVTQEELHDVINQLNENENVDSILVQLPLPRHLSEESALLAVRPEKDVDGLHPVNLGKLVMNSPGPLPCTPNGIQRLLVHYGVQIPGKHVVIVGRGLTIGRPLSLLLAMKSDHANAAVTVVHTGVKDLEYYTKQADILIAAAGSPNMIKPDMVKPGAAVVGAGVTRDGKKIISDVADEVAQVAHWMTPRIGGVGPMTIAMLLENTVRAAQMRLTKE